MPMHPFIGKSLTALPLFLIACAAPRMTPPGDMAGSTVLDSKGRSSASGLFVDESFDLGNYRVAKVDRKWQSSSGFSVGSYNQSKTTTGYSYQLTGGASSWKGVCAVARNEKGASLGLGIAFSQADMGLTCECTGGAQPAHLELQATNEGRLTGSVSPAGQSYALAPVMDTHISSMGNGPGGYRFDGSDGARGAVEAKPGRIWFTSKLAEGEREPATCVLAGLMLFIPPSEPSH